MHATKLLHPRVHDAIRLEIGLLGFHYGAINLFGTVFDFNVSFKKSSFFNF